MIPKFRAWNKSTELMDEAILIDFYNKKIGILYANPISQGESVKTYSFDEVVLMQSTGLYDKNGKEIFEGDILHWKDCEPVDDEMVYEDIIVVYWSDEFMMWKAKNEDTDYIDLYDYSDNRELEVLGNIYENPELLDEVEE